MSFYYISQELAEVLNISTEKRYHIDELVKSLSDSISITNIFSNVCISEKHSKLLLYTNYEKQELHEANKNIKKYLDEKKDFIEKVKEAKQKGSFIHQPYCDEQVKLYELGEYCLANPDKVFLYTNPKRWLEESNHLIPEWKKENEKVEKKLSMILKRIADLEEEHESLVDCSFLTMKLKKEKEKNQEETEKLQQRISYLEAENKQLKQNFKRNVINIVKDYVYSLFFCRR